MKYLSTTDNGTFEYEIELTDRNKLLVIKAEIIKKYGYLKHESFISSTIPDTNEFRKQIKIRKAYEKDGLTFFQIDYDEFTCPAFVKLIDGVLKGEEEALKSLLNLLESNNTAKMLYIPHDEYMMKFLNKVNATLNSSDPIDIEQVINMLTSLQREIIGSKKVLDTYFMLIKECFSFKLLEKKEADNQKLYGTLRI